MAQTIEIRKFRYMTLSRFLQLYFEWLAKQEKVQGTNYMVLVPPIWVKLINIHVVKKKNP